MAYRALYRAYRPRTFSEVIGQSHITTILQNQIGTGKTAHAYLFCGTRGTGKTSTAKILARAVNCLSPKNGEPCGECEACQRSLREACPDITEIDAASNNGVDDIRSLIERAHYAPLELTHRVFIVDEAHMLSNSAFNALLKTLEEPPAHVMFILATTEPQKLPATIISRCQRFDFHRLSVADIEQNLRSVLSRAGASIDEEGLLLIARTADGGMRDALSLADQCLSFCGDKVTAKDVYDVLGSMEQGFLFRIADTLLRSDAQAAIRMLDEIVRGGRDLSVFCQDLSAHFRALLLAKTCGSCEDLLDCTKDMMERYLAQAAPISEARLLLSMEQLLHAQSELRYLSSPRTLLESTLVRICRPEHTLSLESIEARLDRLEREGVKTVAVPPASPAAAPTPMPIAAPTAAASDEDPFFDDIPLPEPPPEEFDIPAEPVFSPRPVPAQKSTPAPAPAVKPAAPAPVTPAPQPTTVSAAKDTNADALWSAALAELAKQNVLQHALTKNGIAQRMEDDTLIVGFDEAHSTQLRSVSAEVNVRKMEAILETLRPGTKISYIRVKPEPISAENEAKLRAVFGDKLTVED